MEIVEESKFGLSAHRCAFLPVSVIIPVLNEARNLSRCLESLRGVGEIYVVDSGSTDETAEIACLGPLNIAASIQTLTILGS